MIKVDTIFCDDIRREMSGKEILIGVYSGDLVPSTMPATIHLSLWLKISGFEALPKLIKVEVRADDGSVLFATELQGRADLNPHMAIALALVGFPITLSTPGSIHAFLMLDGQQLQAGSLIVSAPPN